MPTKAPNATKADVHDLIVRAVQAGETPETVADIFGVSLGNVRQILWRAGVHGRVTRKLHELVNRDNLRNFVRETAGGCWEWPTCNRKGYSRVGSMAGHRLSYQLFHGDVPVGLSVLHKCDNPCCVNPDHLFVGTIVDNMRDKFQKGRQAKGETLGMSKLREAQVIEMRVMRLNGGFTLQALAEKFNVTRECVRLICDGQTWKHVPLPEPSLEPA